MSWVRGLASLLLLLLVSLPYQARADSLAETFSRGNQAFSAGNYETARMEYERLLEAGVSDPDVTFNLASTYGQLGNYGQAIRYFERTLRLRPSDDGAEKALSSARTAVGERTAQRTGEAIVADRPPLSEALFSRATTDTLSCLLLVSVWLTCLCGLALLRLRGEGLRLALGISCAVSCLLSCVAGFGLGTRLDWGRGSTRAIVLSDTPLREGPDMNSPRKSELTEGASARVLSRYGAYLLIQSGSLEGYVLARDVGEI